VDMCRHKADSVVLCQYLIVVTSELKKGDVSHTRESAPSPPSQITISTSTPNFKYQLSPVDPPGKGTSGLPDLCFREQ